MDKPVEEQPQPQWSGMAGFADASRYPPGLAYLAQLDQVLIHQQIELLEAFTGFETKNKYVIKNAMGQQMLFAAEDTSCCNRICCGPLRPFDMNILDNTGMEVIHLYRPLRCQSCCCFCCLQKMEVTAPPGTVIGSIEQECSILFPKFRVYNEAGDLVLRVKGPFWTCSCCRDVNFNILSADGSQQIGKISKQWSGLLKEAFLDADNFGVTFPMDLDVKVKATLLGLTFLIDFMYYEQNQNNN